MVTNYTKFLLTIRIIYLVVKLLVGLAFGLFWVVIKFIALLPKIFGENGLKKITRSSFDIVDRAEHQSEKIDDLEKDFNIEEFRRKHKAKLGKPKKDNNKAYKDIAKLRSQIEIEKQKSKELTEVQDAQAAKEIEEAIDYISSSVSSSTSKPLSFLSNFIDITSSQIGFYMDLFNPNSHAYSDFNSSEVDLHDNSHSNLLKAKGDRYESAVGLGYEVRGDLVIYNGFIKGMKDEGVDIVAISSKQKSIHLVQCKNWDNRQISSEELDDIYNKLDQYIPYEYSVDNIQSALTFLQKPQNLKIKNRLVDVSIEGIKPEFQNFRNIVNKAYKENYPIYKVLYIPKVGSLDKSAIDLSIKNNPRLNILSYKENGLSYKDMSIAITPVLNAKIQ